MKEIKIKLTDEEVEILDAIITHDHFRSSDKFNWFDKLITSKDERDYEARRHKLSKTIYEKIFNKPL